MPNLLHICLMTYLLFLFILKNLALAAAHCVDIHQVEHLI